jgi:hypothetical protein
MPSSALGAAYKWPIITRPRPECGVAAGAACPAAGRVEYGRGRTRLAQATVAITPRGRRAHGHDPHMVRPWSGTPFEDQKTPPPELRAGAFPC